MKTTNRGATPLPPPHDAPTWLRLDGAAARLSCSRRHVQNLIRNGDLKAYRRGGCTWIHVDDIDAFVTAGTSHEADRAA